MKRNGRNETAETKRNEIQKKSIKNIKEKYKEKRQRIPSSSKEVTPGAAPLTHFPGRGKGKGGRDLFAPTRLRECPL